MRNGKSKGRSARAVGVLLLLAIPYGLRAATPAPNAATVLPMTCAELLPDVGPYLSFFEAVGRSAVNSDRMLARHIFKILALREKMVEAADRAREQNPVDVLIRKTLCFYREQREPLKVVGYDDPQLTQFLHSSIRELEGKVQQSIFLWEYDRQERRAYERELERNQAIVDTVREQADVDADRAYEKISEAAKRKVRSQ
jgi:hypothetical protein